MVNTNGVAMELTRKQLFEQVWEKPLREVTKELGLSDVGLAKVCRRSAIPLPGQGYWLMSEKWRARVVQPLLCGAPPGQPDVLTFSAGTGEQAVESEEDAFRRRSKALEQGAPRCALLTTRSRTPFDSSKCRE